MFPGIHYNFACRVVNKHPGRNENVRRRRRGSVNAKVANLAQLPEANLRGELGYALLKSYVDSGQNEMIASLIARGIDVNRPNEKGRTLLQEAISSFKIPVIRELMKAPGINISGALEELEATRTGLIDGEDDEEEKAEIEDEAVQIRNLLRPSVAVGGPVGGPVGGKGGKRRRRKTRRGKRSALKRRTAKYRN
jgi:ankyrin repeat protein